MNLVVFYLQCIHFVPNLQSPALMEAVGLVPDPRNNYWHFVNNLDTCTLTWDAVRKANAWVMPSELDELPMPALLYGFFEFYGFRFPWTFAVSIKQGDIVVPKVATRKVCAFYSIEDPFESYDSHCPHDLGTPCSENHTTRRDPQLSRMVLTARRALFERCRMSPAGCFVWWGDG